MVMSKFIMATTLLTRRVLSFVYERQLSGHVIRTCMQIERSYINKFLSWHHGIFVKLFWQASR